MMVDFPYLQNFSILLNLPLSISSSKEVVQCSECHEVPLFKGSILIAVYKAKWTGLAGFIHSQKNPEIFGKNIKM